MKLKTDRHILSKKKMNNPKILITGSSGFVGKHFLSLFKKHNYKIYSPTRKELNLCDLKQTKKFINLIKPDFVINLASRTNPSVSSRYEFFKQMQNTFLPIDNVTKSINSNVKLIISVGSIEEYGNCLSPFNEKMTPLPSSSYGLVKFISCLKFQNICKEKKIRGIWLRPSLMFGKGMDKKRLLGELINSFKLKKKFVLLNPNSIRDHLYVEDFCRILIYFIKNYKKFKNEIFNVSANNYFKNQQIISMITKLIGNKKNIKVIKKNSNKKDIFTNSGLLLNSKIKNFKYTKFENALRKTLIEEGLLDVIKQ